MSNYLIKSTDELIEIKTLVNKQLPSYRKAYSDRTAWLMAFISELAYLKFNPLLKNSPQTKILEEIESKSSFLNSSAILKLLDLFDYNPEEEREKLKDNADLLELKLIKTFDCHGTQAIILEHTDFICLAFRGTESTCPKDIKSDLKGFKKSCRKGGKVHSGFDEAFDNLAVDIQLFLDQDMFRNKPLYITGHSLGGALAVIATKRLVHDGGIAACYTFGAPRVGNIEWGRGIKTPIYRLVNSLDPVTMLPPSHISIYITSKLLGLLIPVHGAKIADFLLTKFGGYYHFGDMRYLSRCKQSDYSQTKLLYSVSLAFRFIAFIRSKTNYLNIPADHSISVYREKLKFVAMNRN